jgi:hypothetical protein
MAVSRRSIIPHIDADPLAEYILAGPERRREILLEEWREQDGPRYFRAADETVCAYMLGIPKLETGLRMKIDVLRTLGAFAADKQVKIADNIAAIEAFLTHPKREFLDGLETFPGPRQGTLRVAGVDIAVSPEIIAVDARTDSYGFIKLRFSRQPLEPHGADHLTAMLQAFAQSCASRISGTLNLDLTCVVDVFDGTIIRASAARAGRWGSLRAACGEIAANWALLHSRPRGRIASRWRA